MIPASLFSHESIDQLAEALVPHMETIGLRKFLWKSLTGDAAVMGDILLERTGGKIPEVLLDSLNLLPTCPSQ